MYPHLARNAALRVAEEHARVTAVAGNIEARAESGKSRAVVRAMSPLRNK